MQRLVKANFLSFYFFFPSFGGFLRVCMQDVSEKDSLHSVGNCVYGVLFRIFLPSRLDTIRYTYNTYVYAGFRLRNSVL